MYGLRPIHHKKVINNLMYYPGVTGALTVAGASGVRALSGVISDLLM